MTPAALSALSRATLLAASSVLAVTATMVAGTTAVHAQAIALSVNGDPVTSIDIEQRMKLLRAMHRPATRDAAVESMIQTRLKEREASRFGVAIKDSEAPEELQVLAKKMKTSAQQLANDIGHAGVSQSAANSFLKGELGYSVLIRGLNRGVEASEVQVRQELAKEKGKGGITNYTLRQIVFTMDPGDTQAATQGVAKQAESLRGRFTSCESGIPLAKSMPGVAVREKIVRTSAQLGDGMKDVLDKTAIGHLTPGLSRSPNGLELVALCDRSVSRNDDDLRKQISERLLSEHYAQEEAVKYKDLRAHAVIERR